MNRIEYIAADEKRQVIPYVRLDDGQGTVREYFAEGVTDVRALAGERRVLDCIDCHNRPSHTFAYSVERAVDDAITAGGLDASLPFIRREAIKVLKASYPDKAAASEGIPDGPGGLSTGTSSRRPRRTRCPAPSRRRSTCSSGTCFRRCA